MRSSTTGFALLLLAATLFSAQKLGAQTGKPSVPDTLVLERIASEDLEIADAGWARITNQERWHKLWRDYGEESSSGATGELFTPATPAVDFNVKEILAVSFGPASGCNSRVIMVEHVIEYASERVAVITPDNYQSMGPCMMVVYPIDLVVLSRSHKPIRLKLRTRMKDWGRGIPPADRWSVPLSVKAALDSGTTTQSREAYVLSRRVLPRDTTLSLQDYRQLAEEAFRSRDWAMYHRLVSNPRATTDLEVFAWLATSEYGRAHGLRLELLRRFGLRLASRTEAPRPWLEAVMAALMDPVTRTGQEPPYHAVAVALANNPAILRDKQLAMQLTFGVQYYPDVNILACQEYLRRYPPKIRKRGDTTGTGVSTLGPNCPP